MSDPLDPPASQPIADHLAAPWAQGRSTPQWLTLLVVMVGVAVLCAMVTIVYRTHTTSILIRPDESSLTSKSRRAMPSDAIIADATDFVVLTSENWTPETIWQVKNVLEDHLHPSFLGVFTRHIDRLIGNELNVFKSQSAIILGRRIIPAQDHVTVQTVIRQNIFVQEGKTLRQTESEIRIVVWDVVMDVPVGRNLTGLQFTNRQSISEGDWIAAKRPAFWIEDAQKERKARADRLLKGDQRP